ncbi:MAG: hypothetical protein WCI05_12720 [Myxococcales bacterium]
MKPIFQEVETLFQEVEAMLVEIDRYGQASKIVRAGADNLGNMRGQAA